MAHRWQQGSVSSNWQLLREVAHTKSKHTFLLIAVSPLSTNAGRQQQYLGQPLTVPPFFGCGRRYVCDSYYNAQCSGE